MPPVPDPLLYTQFLRSQVRRWLEKFSRPALVIHPINPMIASGDPFTGFCEISNN